MLCSNPKALNLTLYLIIDSNYESEGPILITKFTNDSTLKYNYVVVNAFNTITSTCTASNTVFSSFIIGEEIIFEDKTGIFHCNQCSVNSS